MITQRLLAKGLTPRIQIAIAVRRRFDPASQFLGHELHAIADS